MLLENVFYYLKYINISNNRLTNVFWNDIITDIK